ncbi:MAG: CsgG/HfaB family protein [Victivallaceae bacterium]|nr:CsgG/HfaB family protein [Victivallaceae bacterium]
MKKTWSVLLLAAALLCRAEDSAENANPQTGDTAVAVPTVAVIAFENRDRRQSENADAGKSAAELFGIALAESGSADLVERAELDKALEELHLSASGLTDRDSQLKLGRLIGAKILVTGSIFKSGDKTFVVVKLIGAETSRVIGASSSGKGDFTELITPLADKVSKLLDSQSGKLLPALKSEQTVLEKLSSSVKGNGRKVYIDIRENIMVTVIDPAAETELKKLLLGLGFQVIDRRQNADFVLKGEAIAVEAGHFGKFSSAAARMELSVFGGDDRLLAAGAARDTLAGATYVIAAKDAIGQTALTLAEELFGAMK